MTMELVEYKLGDLADIVTGATPKAHESDSWGNVLDFITPSDQLENSRVAQPARQLSAVGADRLTRRIIPPLSTNLTCIGSTIGKVTMSLRECVTNQQINSLVAIDGVSDPRFLYYMIKNWSADLPLYASGSATPIVNKSVLSKFSFLVPDIDLQRSISAVLSALDDKIAGNQALVTAADKLARAILIGVVARAPIGDLVVHRKTIRLPEQMGSAKVSHHSLPAFDSGHIPELANSRDIKSGKFAIENPSVLISKLNPRFPRIWDLPVLSELEAYASTEFLVLEPKFCSTSVLATALRQPEVSAQLESKVAGTSGSHQRVRPADLLATEIVDPRCLDSARLDLISSLGLTVWTSRRESVALAELRDVLLPQLMSGELRVRDAEKVVEEVL